jgi:hypothetical protein
MYALIKDGKIVQTASNAKSFFPNTSFPSTGISIDFLQSNSVYEVVDGPREDERFYWVTPAQPLVQMINGIPTRVYISTPKDLDQLKEQHIAQAKENANKTLASTDWVVTRKAERGIEIPQDIAEERLKIIFDCESKEEAILKATTVEELKNVLVTPEIILNNEMGNDTVSGA